MVADAFGLVSDDLAWMALPQAKKLLIVRLMIEDGRFGAFSRSGVAKSARSVSQERTQRCSKNNEIRPHVISFDDVAVGW